MSQHPLFAPDALAGIPSAAKLLGYYLEDLPAQIDQIAAALGEHNYEAVGQLAHSLKSSSRQIGALQVGEVAYLVEQGARSTPQAPDLPTRIQRLEDCALQTLTAIKTYRQNHQS